METKWGSGSYHPLKVAMMFDDCSSSTPLWCVFLARIPHAPFTKSNVWLWDQFCSQVIVVAVAWESVQSLQKSKTSILFYLLSTKQISLLTPSLHILWWYWRHTSIWIQNFSQQWLPVEFLPSLENTIDLKSSLQNTLTPCVLHWIIPHWPQ